jgi:hypothetical protein
MDLHEGIPYRVIKVPAGWRWTVFLGTNIQMDGQESTKTAAVLMAEKTIEDFLWKKNGPQ